MKRKLLLLSFLAFFFLSSCWPPEEENSKFQPILMTKEQLAKSISLKPARALTNTGKIYQKDSYIFINEKYIGVHIIDNQKPSEPKNIGFITAPGCIDMAIKNNSLYLDNATDLVAIDISDISNISVTQRVENVFPELFPPDLVWLPTEYTKGNRPENTVIVGWEKKIN